MGLDIREAVRQSNLIESVNSLDELDQSMLAWEFISSQPMITNANVLHTHRLITYNFPHAYPGEYRKVNVEVLGRKCPHYSQVPMLIDNWIFDMQNPADFTPKDMHIKFERIHPFRDGNGRVGRMLYWWHQKRIGKEMTMIEFDSRWNYYDWFESE